MKQEITVRQAAPTEAATVSAVLHEATRWLTERGEPLWCDDELDAEQIDADVAAGLFFVAKCAGEIAGVMKFQLEDPLFWPDQPPGEACFVHRLAVRRKFAGGAVSSALLTWAAQQTRRLGRRYLRLDTDAARPKLRAVYERFGFTHHSNRQVGPYFVARYELGVTASVIDANSP